MNAMGGLERVRSGELLYTDEVGHDACGIGGIAARDGKPSPEVLRKALTALKCMEHRGGVCGDAGDGAGITTVIPQAVLQGRSEAPQVRRRALPQARRHARRRRRLPRRQRPGEDRSRPAHSIREALAGGPVQFLGCPSGADQRRCAARDAPGAPSPAAIEQVLLQVKGDARDAERWLYLRRLELRETVRGRGARRSTSRRCRRGSSATRGCSPARSWPTSTRTCRTRRSRPASPSSTAATAPTPSRTGRSRQPFRLTCHNGEINTIRTNRNAVSAFARGLKPPLPGGDLLTPKMSDSASLDEWLEYLMLEQNWSLLRALRLSIPPVWDTEADVWGQEAFDLFTYCRRTFGSLARVGRPGRDHRHRRPHARRAGGSHGSAAGALVFGQPRLALHRQRVRRLRPRHHHHRRQRSASAGADDRARHRDRRAARQPPDHGAASWPRRRRDSATFTN